MAIRFQRLPGPGGSSVFCNNPDLRFQNKIFLSFTLDIKNSSSSEKATVWSYDAWQCIICTCVHVAVAHIITTPLLQSVARNWLLGEKTIWAGFRSAGSDIKCEPVDAFHNRTVLSAEAKNLPSGENASREASKAPCKVCTWASQLRFTPSTWAQASRR